MDAMDEIRGGNPWMDFCLCHRVLSCFPSRLFSFAPPFPRPSQLLLGRCCQRLILPVRSGEKAEPSLA